jgi:hypothetical protein
MRTYLTGGFIVASLLTIGCGNAKVNVDDINGFNPGDAKNAIFANIIEPTDFDGDGVIDFDLSGIAIVASDQDDLCAAIEADPEALENLPDIQMIQIAAFQVAAAGQGVDIAAGTIDGNVGLFELFFEATPGDTVVTSIVTIREGGVDQVNATDDAIFEDGDAVLELIELVPGDVASADFTGTLTQDIAIADLFDTDFDGDGVNDFQSISASVDASFKNVSFCAALANL